MTDHDNKLWDQKFNFISYELPIQMNFYSNKLWNHWILSNSEMFNWNFNNLHIEVSEKHSSNKKIRESGLDFCFYIINPLTQMVHKTWTFLIITHNSWYRIRKIKEDSSTERENFPLQFEPIFITIQCTSRSQDFSNEKWSRNLQIGNAFNDWNSTISHANWQCLTKKSYNFFYFFLFVMRITPLLEVPFKEIKKICCQFEWWNRDLILLKINPVRGWVKCNALNSKNAENSSHVKSLLQ